MHHGFLLLILVITFIKYFCWWVLFPSYLIQFTMGFVLFHRCRYSKLNHHPTTTKKILMWLQSCVCDCGLLLILMCSLCWCQQKAGPLKTQTQIAPAVQGPVTLQLPMSVAGTSVQQVQVPGSKFHYVRLVSPTTQSTIAGERQGVDCHVDQFVCFSFVFTAK